MWQILEKRSILQLIWLEEGKNIQNEECMIKLVVKNKLKLNILEENDGYWGECMFVVGKNSKVLRKLVFRI